MYVGKTITNHPMFDGLYHLFMVNLGIVYYCFNHIICHFDKGQGDDSPNPILIPYCLLYPHIILNPHTAIPIIPKLPDYNIYIYIHIYIYIYVFPLLYIFTMWAPVYKIAKLGATGPQLDGSADLGRASLWRPAPPRWTQWRCNKQTPEGEIDGGPE